MVVFGRHEHEEGAGVPRVSNNEEASSTLTSCVGVGDVWYVMIRRIGGACVFFIFAIYCNYDMYCALIMKGIDNYVDYQLFLFSSSFFIARAPLGFLGGSAWNSRVKNKDFFWKTPPIIFIVETSFELCVCIYHEWYLPSAWVGCAGVKKTQEDSLILLLLL